MEKIQEDEESQTQPSSSLFTKPNYHVTLKFENVVYRIDIQNTQGIFKKQLKSEEKIILNGITGSVLPGELLAMLGPSGSGKTTMLTALGGRLGGKLSGNITFNDKLLSNFIKRNTGFVTQDDVMYPHLTVIETLVYTALLRLPRSITREEKVQHAEGVISKLGLTNCRNSIIGDAYVRGVSGGERKRVSIGQEMLINPSVLLLDEPTSGLDSTIAQRIVSTLWDLANGGRTVVMTIHQPSSRLFYMFHKVLLLSEGNTMYYGKGEETMNYFSSIGYAPSVTMNPSDFLLDLANGIVLEDSEEYESTTKQSLISAFMRIKAESVSAELQQASDYIQNAPEDKENAKWRTNWWQQFTILLSRGLKERKHESFAGLRIGEVLVISFVTGLLWWKSNTAHIQDQTGLLFSYTAFWGFVPLYQAIFTFPQERKMLEKERTSGMYRLSSYFMSRVVGDLPMELVLPTVYVVITYWMAGLRPTFKNFFLTLLSILYSVLVSQGLGLAIGALVMDQQAATTLGSVVMLSFLLAGGFYVQHVPGFISWIKYISMIQHTYKLLLVSQYKSSDTYPCGENMCFVKDSPMVKAAGLDRPIVAVVALGIMLIGYRLVAYLALMRIGLTK